MTTLYAQPYDITASGFYFDSAEAFENKSRDLRNEHGEHVEEFEIQFIDGSCLDGKLFEGLRINQSSVGSYFEATEGWSEDEKLKVLVGVGEIGMSFDVRVDETASIEVEIYECDSLRDLAEQFVDDGLFGEIPPPLSGYIDFEAIARDLACDFGTVDVCGRGYAFRA